MKTCFINFFLLFTGFASLAQAPAGSTSKSPGAGAVTLWYAADEVVLVHPTEEDCEVPRRESSAQQVPHTAPVAAPDFSFEVKVLPNPCSDWLEVNVKSAVSGPMEIQLWDLEGRQVGHYRTRNGERVALLPVSGLLPGLFYLTVRDKTGHPLVTLSVEKV